MGSAKCRLGDVKGGYFCEDGGSSAIKSLRPRRVKPTLRLMIKVPYNKASNPFIVIKSDVKSTAKRMAAFMIMVKSPRVIQMSGARISLRIGRIIIFPSIKNTARVAKLGKSGDIWKPGM